MTNETIRKDAPARTGRKAKRWLRRIVLFLLLAAVLALAAWLGISSLRAKYTVVYDGYTASIGSISNALSFKSSLQLVDSQSYTADKDATVRALYVSEGDAVSAGDRLMRLSNGQTVKANFDGKINQVYASEGDEVAAGAELVQLADFAHMKVSLRVDEYDIADVHVGDACTVTTAASSREYESTIASINYISASSGSVAYYTALVYVTVDTDVYPGMQVTVTLPREEAENVVILKEDALSFTAGNSAFVYMKDENGDMTPVAVEVGVHNGNYAEIRSGVSAGDTVYAVSESSEEAAVGLGGLLNGLMGGGMPSGMPSGMPGGSDRDFRQMENFGGGGSNGGQNRNR